MTNDMQNLVMQAQSIQQQLQMVMTQKETLNLQLIEVNKALQELKGGGEEVYKVLGPVLVKVKVSEAKKDLDEKKELMMLRVKALERSESKLKEGLEDLKGKLTEAGG